MKVKRRTISLFGFMRKKSLIKCDYGKDYTAARHLKGSLPHFYHVGGTAHTPTTYFPPLPSLNESRMTNIPR